MLRRSSILLALVVACLLSPHQTLASIEIEGHGPLGHYEATLSYAFANATHASLTVDIINLNLTSAGGKLVAFLFNNPNNSITGVTLGVNNTNLTKVLGGSSFVDTIKAAPFEKFDIGVSLGGNNNNGFEGAGGSPNPGIARGATGHFVFNFIGTGLNLLTTQSFIDSLNESNGEYFIARFKGFDNGGSDKVVGGIYPPPQVHAPEPASLMLWTLLGGSAAFVWVRRPAR